MAILRKNIDIVHGAAIINPRHDNTNNAIMTIIDLKM